jgi:hypothetical protein
MMLVRFASNHPTTYNTAHYFFPDERKTLCGLKRTTASIIEHNHLTRVCQKCAYDEAQQYRSSRDATRTAACPEIPLVPMI